MTALVMKGDRERCIEAGMDGYLSKPIRQQELDQVLDSYVIRERVDFTPPPEATPQEPSVATKELLERIDGDRVFLAELLDLFRQDYPGQLRAAHEAAGTGDAAGLQRVGHALKGALGNLAARHAADLAGELEAMGRSGNIQAAAATANELERELERVVEILDGVCMEVTR
jgi:HPt (histidine-containing phosphotransfer) domain-containing protein